jgi:hypothetical protein
MIATTWLREKQKTRTALIHSELKVLAELINKKEKDERLKQLEDSG